MLLPESAVHTDPQAAAGAEYDAVIVGAGIAGAIIAKELSQAGQRVLVLEAGVGEHYHAYLERFYAAANKDNQAPYALNPDAPS
ncbi:MAG TPA: FAD-dependent oxidoreductase, partial [Acidisphaera sp.]|nr:FAD-dependent oxidoreductase [Acidisphaera sp.]